MRRLRGSFETCGERGISLLAAIFAMAIGGVVVAGLTTIMSNTLRGQRHVELSSDREAIKRMLLSTVSCEETLGAGPCTPGAIVPLKKKTSGGTVVDVVSSVVNEPTRFGPWAVKAECSDDGDSVLVRTARLKPGGTLASTSTADFAADPLTGKVYTWEDSKSLLLPADLSLCFSGGGAAGYKLMNVKVLANDGGAIAEWMDDASYAAGWVGNTKEILMDKDPPQPDRYTAMGNFLNTQTHSMLFVRGAGRTLSLSMKIKDLTAGTEGLYWLQARWKSNSNDNALLGGLQTGPNRGTSVTPGHTYEFEFKCELVRPASEVTTQATAGYETGCGDIDTIIYDYKRP